MGFNLKKIKELLSPHDHPNASRGQVKTMTQDKLAEIEHRISDLVHIRDALARLEKACSGREPVRGCPIIQSLGDGNNGADGYSGQS